MPNARLQPLLEAVGCNLLLGADFVTHATPYGLLQHLRASIEPRLCRAFSAARIILRWCSGHSWTVNRPEKGWSGTSRSGTKRQIVLDPVGECLTEFIDGLPLERHDIPDVDDLAMEQIRLLIEGDMGEIPFRMPSWLYSCFCEKTAHRRHGAFVRLFLWDGDDETRHGHHGGQYVLWSLVPRSVLALHARSRLSISAHGIFARTGFSKMACTIVYVWLSLYITCCIDV